MILLKIRLQDLSGEAYYNQKDLDDLTDYLFSVEYWGYYELLIFSNTLDVLKHDVFMVLAREMSRRSDFYKEISEYTASILKERPIWRVMSITTAMHRSPTPWNGSRHTSHV